MGRKLVLICLQSMFANRPIDGESPMIVSLKFLTVVAISSSRR